MDIFLRNWCVDAGLYPQSKCENLSFGNYQELIKFFKLDNKVIILMRKDYFLKPFNDSLKSPPNWWIFYDNVKHNGFYHKEEGNLYNVIESLSALFLLNCIHNKTNKIMVNAFVTSHRNYVEFSGFTVLEHIESELFEFKTY